MAKKKITITTQVDETLNNLISTYAKQEFGGNKSLALRKIIEKFLSRTNKEE